jgi:hypothetical protein
MIICDPHTDAYQLGWRAALAEVREYQQRGLWTKALRSRLVRSAVYQRKQMERNHPCLTGVIRYLAGRIAALRSQMTADFAQEKNEHADLLSRSLSTQQERLREACIYTDVSDWDWEEDEEDERDFVFREMMLRASCSRDLLSLDAIDIWLCIICLTFFPVVSLYYTLCLLIFSAMAAYEMEDLL